MLFRCINSLKLLFCSKQQHNRNVSKSDIYIVYAAMRHKCLFGLECWMNIESSVKWFYFILTKAVPHINLVSIFNRKFFFLYIWCFVQVTSHGIIFDVCFLTYIFKSWKYTIFLKDDRARIFKEMYNKMMKKRNFISSSWVMWGEKG